MSVHEHGLKKIIGTCSTTKPYQTKPAIAPGPSVLEPGKGRAIWICRTGDVRHQRLTPTPHALEGVGSSHCGIPTWPKQPSNWTMFGTPSGKHHGRSRVFLAGTLATTTIGCYHQVARPKWCNCSSPLDGLSWHPCLFQFFHPCLPPYRSHLVVGQYQVPQLFTFRISDQSSSLCGMFNTLFWWLLNRLIPTQPKFPTSQGFKLCNVSSEAQMPRSYQLFSSKLGGISEPPRMV